MLAVEHRQAPEHAFPAPLDDVRAALRWSAAAPAALGAARVGVAGHSSGANLAAAAARHVEASRCRSSSTPPSISRARPHRSRTPTASSSRARSSARARYVAGADPADPDLSPLLAADVSGLAPAVVCVAEYDVLREQGLAYAGRLRAAGVPVRVVDGHGLDHAFLAWGEFARRPAEAIAELGAAVRELLGT